MLTRMGHPFLYLSTTRRRIAAVVALVGLALTAVLAVTHSAHADQKTVTAGAAWNQAGMAGGALLSTGGCVVAPSPMSCGSAVTSTTLYMNAWGDEPMHGNSDMTQDGPLPAL